MTAVLSSAQETNAAASDLPPFLHDLPTNIHGRLTRSSLLRELGEKAQTWNMEQRPFITTFSGSRTGAKPIYMETGKAIGKMIDGEGWVAVNGGTSPGVMGAVLENCSRQICFVPKLFAISSGAGVPAENFYAHAVSRIVPDFWERKAGMTIISGGFLALPGGFGSLDEIFEAIIFAAKTGKKLVFVNQDGYWNNTLKLLSYFAAQGLMPQHYANCYFEAPTAEAAIEIMKHNGAKPIPLKRQKKRPIATESLRSFLARNPNALPDALHSFIKGAPRVGIIASGNIGKENEPSFNLSDQNQRAHFVSSVSDIGHQFADAGAALLIIGNRRGLRARMAQAALESGGKVIWLQKSHTRKPLSIREIGTRELLIEAPRYYERARLFATIAQSMCYVAGGIHTANEALSHVTRNQTGHGDYCDLVPHCRDAHRPKMVADAYDPPLNQDGLRLWEPLENQIRTCIQEGFINPKDEGLLRFNKQADSIVDDVLSRIENQPDFLHELAKKGRPKQVVKGDFSKGSTLAR